MTNENSTRDPPESGQQQRGVMWQPDKTNKIHATMNQSSATNNAMTDPDDKFTGYNRNDSLASTTFIVIEPEGNRLRYEEMTVAEFIERKVDGEWDGKNIINNDLDLRSETLISNETDGDVLVVAKSKLPTIIRSWDV